MPKPKQKPVHKRFAALLAWLHAELGWSQEDVGQRIGCSQAFVSKLVNGEKNAGLNTATEIEALSANWPPGPIRSGEWMKKPKRALPASPLARAS